MALIGILGGMGPLATVDFMAKVMQLTGATCDQQHLPMLVANLPHVADRSRAILGDGEDCLDGLLEGIDLLNRNGVGLVAIPCNSAHHWYAQMQARSDAPVLHIADACVAAVPDSVRRVVFTSTVGAIFGDYIDVMSMPGRILSEAHFNSTSSLTHNPYHYSKVMAEKEAWNIAERQARWSA